MDEVRIAADWISYEQARESMASRIGPWVKAQFAAGNRLHVELRPWEDAKSDRQRRFYHGIVLRCIAAQARPGGQAHSLAVWKEYFRGEFLGFKRRTYQNPVTGRRSRRRVRVSSEDLGVRAYARLIEQVMAYATTELGVVFPALYEEWERCQIDLETGEIIGGVMG